MPYVKRTASGRIASVYDRPSREAKERIRANDPELLRFLGLAPTQSASAAEHEMFVAPAPSKARRKTPAAPPPPPLEASPDEDVDGEAWHGEADEADSFGETSGELTLDADEYGADEWVEPDADAVAYETKAPAASEDGYDLDFGADGDGPTIDITDDSLPAGQTHAHPASARKTGAPATASQRPMSRPDTPRPARRAQPPGRGDAAAAAGDGPGDTAALRQLDASDMEMARITEDLIDLLIGRNIINFTDFPNMAQRKLITRRALRSNMSALTNLVGDEESIF